MRRTFATAMVVGTLALPITAMGQRAYGAREQGVPPGYVPPSGTCRVWYDGLAPEQQPAPTSCDAAERIVATDRQPRVIYSTPVNTPDAAWRPDRERPIGFDRVSFENGYHDGYDQGRSDAKDRDQYDPASHSRYKSADRKYEKEYGSKDRYKAVYRDGFLTGYAEAFRAATGVDMRSGAARPY